MTLVEERIVLFKARDGDEAIQQAEREARHDARDMHINPYGQKVITRYLGACDAYEMFEAPGAEHEVFSTTQVVTKKVTDRQIVNQRVGPRETKRVRSSRRMFIDREFAGTVKRDV
jgi:hypothetical protein